MGSTKLLNIGNIYLETSKEPFENDISKNILEIRNSNYQQMDSIKSNKLKNSTVESSLVLIREPQFLNQKRLWKTVQNSQSKNGYEGQEK